MYKVTSSDLEEKLDNYEAGYKRELINVFSAQGSKSIKAEVYISTDITTEPVAYDRYKDIIIDGAKEHNLPVDYIKYLKGLPSRPKKT